MERRKVYVKVNADHDQYGKYEIDRVRQAVRAASTKVGGTGIRYTVSICGKDTFLFDEENGKWFVEAK